MKKFLFLSTILAGTLIFSGCATMFSKSKYPVKIDASSPNAKFEIRDDQGKIVARGNIPATVELDAGGSYGFVAVYQVDFFSRKEEKILDESGKVVCINETRSRNTYPLVGKRDPWVRLNVLNFDLFEIVDVCTGAAYELPETFFVELPTEENPVPKTFVEF